MFCKFSGVSLSTLFGDYIPGWADRIARDCASAMYKVWQVGQSLPQIRICSQLGVYLQFLCCCT